MTAPDQARAAMLVESFLDGFRPDLGDRVVLLYDQAEEEGFKRGFDAGYSACLQKIVAATEAVKREAAPLMIEGPKSAPPIPDAPSAEATCKDSLHVDPVASSVPAAVADRAEAWNQRGTDRGAMPVEPAQEQHTSVAPAPTGERPREPAGINPREPAAEGQLLDGGGRAPVVQAAGKPGVPAELPKLDPPKWTAARKALLTATYATADQRALLAEVNALPGDPVTLVQMIGYASGMLRLLRDPGVVRAAQLAAGQKSAALAREKKAGTPAKGHVASPPPSPSPPTPPPATPPPVATPSTDSKFARALKLPTAPADTTTPIVTDFDTIAIRAGTWGLQFRSRADLDAVNAHAQRIGHRPFALPQVGR